MGRHAAPARRTGHPGRGQEVVAWGAFTVPLTVVVLFVVGVDWPVMAGVAVLGVVSFGLVWAATRLVGGSTAPDGDEPSDGSSA
ncbi:MAG: hypothetical protein ACLGIV_06955 [Actinomycetes bacterium]